MKEVKIYTKFRISGIDNTRYTVQKIDEHKLLLKETETKTFISKDYEMSMQEYSDLFHNGLIEKI